MARDLPDTRSSGSECQSVALLRGLRWCHHRPDPGIDAGRCCRADRTDLCRCHGLYRSRSQQGLALDAQRLFREHGVADRRCFRVLDRLPQERARAAPCAALGAQTRSSHHRAWLCGCAFRFHAGASYAVEHRAGRWHNLSDRQQHSQDLWLRAGTNGRQDRHLCDVGCVRDHRGYELVVSDGAGAEFNQPDDGGICRDLADARDRRDRVR